MKKLYVCARCGYDVVTLDGKPPEFPCPICTKTTIGDQQKRKSE